MEVHVYVVRNVLVFEGADVGLKHVKRQTDVQTDTQRNRQTKYSPIQ
jgi:hypothetical protein